MVAPLLNYMRDHGVSIDMSRCMNILDIKKSLTYGANSSAVKEKTFVREELDEQLRAGHTGIF